MISRLERGEPAAASTLTIAQVCGYHKRRGKADVIPRFLSFLKSLANLTKVETLYSDFIEAEALQAEHRLEWRLWDDLILSGQMKRLKASEIYSNDGDFDSIPGVKRIFE